MLGEGSVPHKAMGGAGIASTVPERWREVAALEQAPAGVAAVLDKDLVVPSVREAIDALRAELQGLREHLGVFDAPFEFSDVRDAEVAAFRELLDRVVEAKG